MNLSPSRHPAFFAIACLSLLAAWSTPEADMPAVDAPRVSSLALGEAMPPMFKAPAAVEANCIGHAGAQRALCVYAATRHVGTNAVARVSVADQPHSTSSAASEAKPLAVDAKPVRRPSAPGPVRARAPSPSPYSILDL